MAGVVVSAAVVCVGCLCTGRTEDVGFGERPDSERPEIQALLQKVTLNTHKRAVWRAAQEIIKVRSSIPEIADADPFTSELAAFLHDVGGGGAANAKPGADITLKLLTDMKLESATVNRVARIVETHHATNNFTKNDDTPEWRIVMLADSPEIYPAFMTPEEFAARKKRRQAGTNNKGIRSIVNTRTAFVAALRKQLVVVKERAERAKAETMRSGANNL